MAEHSPWVTFDKIHSPAGRVYLSESLTTLYGDGASMQGHALMSVMQAPSPDPHERARAIARFYKHALNQAVNRFRDQQDNLRSWALAAKTNGSSPPPPSALAALEAQKAEVESLKEKLADAEAEVEATTPQHVRERREFKASQQKAADEFLGLLARIEI